LKRSKEKDFDPLKKGESVFYLVENLGKLR